MESIKCRQESWRQGSGICFSWQLSVPVIVTQATVLSLATAVNSNKSNWLQFAVYFFPHSFLKTFSNVPQIYQHQLSLPILKSLGPSSGSTLFGASNNQNFRTEADSSSYCLSIMAGFKHLPLSAKLLI